MNAALSYTTRGCILMCEVGKNTERGCSNEIMGHMVDYIREAIEYYKNGIKFSEFGW